MEASKGGTVLSDSDIREEVGGQDEDVFLRMIIIKHVKMRLFLLVIIIKKGWDVDMFPFGMIVIIL